MSLVILMNCQDQTSLICQFKHLLRRMRYPWIEAQYWLLLVEERQAFCKWCLIFFVAAIQMDFIYEESFIPFRDLKYCHSTLEWLIFYHPSLNNWVYSDLRSSSLNRCASSKSSNLHVSISLTRMLPVLTFWDVISFNCFQGLIVLKESPLIC